MFNVSTEPTRPAAELAEILRLSAAAKALLCPEMSVRALADRLAEAGLCADAVAVMPHLLTKQAAVWWGCLCAWDGVRGPGKEPFQAALGAAVRWVLEPGEQTRRQAEAAGQAAGALSTPAGALAMAAFWSDGSMSRPEFPPVPPPPDLTASVVGGAVLLAAAQQAPQQMEAMQRNFLTLARFVERGALHWQHTIRSTSAEKSRNPLVEATS